MKITRLSWAGLLLESPSTTLYIDPLQNVAHLAAFLGPPKFPVLPIPAPKFGPANVLVTHIHPDHFDQPYLGELLKNGGELWGPGPVHGAALAMGLTAYCPDLYETFAVGDFRITAVPAVDWIGDEQVSYVVSDGQHTILHGGDTNWHGYWWNIAQRFGPLDVAFLPVNGVVGAVPGVNPASGIFGTMTPAQAVTATRLLGAPALVPMHYAQFDNPPVYQQFPAIESALDEAGNQQQVAIRRLKDGETIDL
ncbi:MBL fold metallo-hydrolase [Hymenobacter daeguensis]